MTATVAALYVEADGVYSRLDGVDCWDVERDARRYLGPHPVVAHPPCKRWGRYWHGGPSARRRMVKGDDQGCFKSALSDVRTWGGVLEHPEASHAWAACGLSRPPRSGGWVRADPWGWTCCVEQGHYGHRARKATWLYAARCDLPELRWGPSVASVRLDHGYHSAEERARAKARGEHRPSARLTAAERLATPRAFAQILVSMARTAAARQGGLW